MNEFLNHLEIKPLDETSVRMMNPLKLAYIGDAVYELYIRTFMISRANKTPHEMNKLALKYVKASSQAQIVRSLQDYLTEEEWDLIKRGRNQKTPTVPKNASLSDYRYATGFETLLGYLHLIGNHVRLSQIISRAIINIENEVSND